jgi:hypothetical protein
MKTKELIKQLLDADPSGEREVCVGNVDIFFVEKMPAFYDGRLQVLQRDENLKGYNIVGAKLVSSGLKINIHTMSIFDALWDNPNLPIDYSDLSQECAVRYKESHEKTRQQVLDCENKIEVSYFVDFVKTKADKITDDMDGVVERARLFFEENLSPKDPIPNDIPIEGESYVSRRNKQWEQQIDVTYNGSDIVISKR